MPRRWVWSLLDFAALICLGQAVILAQRAPEALPRSIGLAEALELPAQAQDFARAGTRIYETPESVVVALKIPERQARPARVDVREGRIRLDGAARGELQELPVPDAADPARFSVRRVGAELRIVFARRDARVSL